APRRGDRGLSGRAGESRPGRRRPLLRRGTVPTGRPPRRRRVARVGDRALHRRRCPGTGHHARDARSRTSMTPATRALTVVVPIDGSVSDLAELLKEIHDDLDGNPILHPEDLPDTHFTRFVIVEDPKKELDPLLVWESNFDGKIDEYA